MWKQILEKLFLSKTDDLTFKKYDAQKIDYNSIDNLYIHIPFCRNTCPYCPYFKMKYSKEEANRLDCDLQKEIEMHSENLKGKTIQSLYIGGGTPTLMSETLKKSIDLLKSFCTIDKIAIETNPEEINDELLTELEQMGCNLISLGIQDFNQKHLNLIGRNYNKEIALRAINKAKERKFETINIDLIFAYPEQTIEELDETLNIAIESQVDQITLYPLFTFSYSSIGRFNKLKKVILPNGKKRKRFYYYICEKLKSQGYQQISVWGFLKNGNTKYSSVTRDYYLGLGPSAATYTGKQFLFNSFNLEHYSDQINQGKHPYSIIMNVSENLEKLFWIYWRFYETVISTNDYRQKFKSEFKSDFKKLIYTLKILGYTKKKDDKLVLVKKGIHRIHLLQNQLALNYITQIWTENTNQVKAEEIKLK